MFAHYWDIYQLIFGSGLPDGQQIVNLIATAELNIVFPDGKDTIENKLDWECGAEI